MKENGFPMMMRIYVLCAFMSYSLSGAKEIELKISVSDECYHSVEAWLACNGKFQGESMQTEYYVTHPQEPWDYSKKFKDTLKTIRVRCEAKGDSFCYKYRHLDPVTGKTTHRDEYETKIADGAIMLAILESMGYTEKTCITKKRSTYLVQNVIEAVLDEVAGVGKFIEVELKTSVNTVAEGKKLLEGLLRDMGITEYKEYDRGYIHMIWNPGYDFGELKKLNV